MIHGIWRQYGNVIDLYSTLRSKEFRQMVRKSFNFIYSWLIGIGGAPSSWVIIILYLSPLHARHASANRPSFLYNTLCPSKEFRALNSERGALALLSISSEVHGKFQWTYVWVNPSGRKEWDRNNKSLARRQVPLPWNIEHLAPSCWSIEGEVII